MSDDPRTPDDPDEASHAWLTLTTAMRPQGFGSTAVDRIVEPLVEPLWAGVRVIAAARGGQAGLLDDGVEVDGHLDIVAALGAMTAATTTGVILDGYITRQAIAEDARIYTGLDDIPSLGQRVGQSLVGVRRNRAAEMSRQLEAEAEARRLDDGLVNLVLVDILWLDGERLLDVPLLERKRLLESVVPGDHLVRTGPFVRPPIATWVGSWRAQGFSGLTFKAANSRYRPGERATDWAKAAMPRR